MISTLISDDYMTLSHTCEQREKIIFKKVPLLNKCNKLSFKYLDTFQQCKY